MRRTLVLAFVSLFIPAAAQVVPVDSLIRMLPACKTDSCRLQSLTSIVFGLLKTDPPRALKYSEQELRLASDMKNEKGMIAACINRGLVYYYLDKYEESITNFLKAEELNSRIPVGQQSQSQLAHLYNGFGITYLQMGKSKEAIGAFRKTLEVRTKAGNKSGIATAYVNLGVAYYKQGDFSTALRNYLEAARLRESLGEIRELGAVYLNMGVICAEQGLYDKALEYYTRSLKIDEDAGDKQNAATVLNNIAIVYNATGRNPEALVTMKKSLRLREEIGDKSGIAESCSNLADIYVEMGDLASAAYFADRSVNLNEEVGDQSGLVYALQSLANIYVKKKKFSEAAALLERCVQIDRETGASDELIQSYLALGNCHYQGQDFRQAAGNYRKYIDLNDSLNKQEVTRQLAEMQTRYETDKKEQENRLLSKENELKNTEIESHKQTRNYIIAIAAIIFLFSVYLAKSIRKTRKQNLRLSVYNKQVIEQNREISRQKELVEEHQKEIIDSITYAKRLQQAILPPEEDLKKQLPESFLLYRPKDIVAGDFYWMHRDAGTTWIAAADCTGHGVPGAMVSVVCSNALDRSVKEFNLTDTGKILDKTRELVLETFSKSSADVKDGMDVSLLRISRAADTLSVQWSGANNPLWIINNGIPEEITADKQPVGKTDDPKPFTSHSVQVRPGSMVYLMTDGYPDQFGGPKGKKFKYRQLQEKLSAISSLEPNEQKEILERTFNEWKGDLEQVDDVTLIGIRIC